MVGECLAGIQRGTQQTVANICNLDYLAIICFVVHRHLFVDAMARKLDMTKYGIPSDLGLARVH